MMRGQRRQHGCGRAQGPPDRRSRANRVRWGCRLARGRGLGDQRLATLPGGLFAGEFQPQAHGDAHWQGLVEADVEGRLFLGIRMRAGVAAPGGVGGAFARGQSLVQPGAAVECQQGSDDCRDDGGGVLGAEVHLRPVGERVLPGERQPGGQRERRFSGIQLEAQRGARRMRWSG